MGHRLGGILSTLLVLAVATGCGGDDEGPEPAPTSTSPSATPEPSPEPTSAIPGGTGTGDVELTVAGEAVPGDDWTTTCFDDDGGIGFSGTATPLSTVQVGVSADGTITRLVASGEGYGPFSADGAEAAGLAVELTETGLELSGSIEGAGEVSGTLTCPA